MAIKFLLMQNTAGMTRLAKWYVPLDEKRKRGVEFDVHRSVATRRDDQTNFLQYSLNPKDKPLKIVYRRYADLFFSMCVDEEDSGLLALETIHLLVELLDATFANVNELDLVFNFAKVYDVLDQFIVGGELVDTSKMAILQNLRATRNLD